MYVYAIYNTVIPDTMWNALCGVGYYDFICFTETFVHSKQFFNMFTNICMYACMYVHIYAYIHMYAYTLFICVRAYKLITKL